MRAALYVRVSTEDQAKEGYSLEAQLKRLRSYCKARDWDVASEYVDDGHSGRSTKRPAYQRMMDESAVWDVLVVLKMDRIHRNSMNFTLMMNDLRSKDKEFNSMQESFDTTTAMGRFVMDVIQRIAQLESEQIGERVRIGMEQKARRGAGYLGSGHPYGFEYGDGGLRTVPDEADNVGWMFDSYADGWSLGRIADDLNERGVPSKRGGEWSKQAVSKMLRNPLYCGYILWDGILRRETHDVVVDIDLYNRVQREFSNRSRNGQVADVTLIGCEV